jgi:pimeloyl-ACP methyl ester carboxylesterase
MTDTTVSTTDAPIEGPWTHEQVHANDLRVHYVTAGDGEPVLFLHGFPEFWYGWRNQLPALADAGYRAIAPDLRGYNRTERPEEIEQYRIDRLVEDVVALVERLCDGSATIVGHDWGGGIAWEVAGRRPEVVDRVAVLNAPHPKLYERELQSLDQLLRSWYVLYFQLPVVPDRLLGAFDARFLGRYLAEASEFEDAFSATDIERYRRAACRPGAPTAAINYYRALFRSTLREKLPLLSDGDGHPGAMQAGRIEVPTLVCWGLQDEALVPELTVGLDEWVSDLRLERIPRASHWLHHEVPEQVNEALLDWLVE